MNNKLTNKNETFTKGEKLVHKLVEMCDSVQLISHKYLLILFFFHFKRQYLF